MISFTKGCGVYHPLYGTGIVLKERYRGYEYLVSFQRFKLWVKANELSPETSAGIKIVKLDNSAFEERKDVFKKFKLNVSSQPISPQKVDALKIIESFRLGIVPPNAVSEWTEGRENEMAEIHRWLESEAEGALVMEGAYGSGKTHMLLYLSDEALKKNYAVSHADFDPSEATAAFPKKVYRRIISNFKISIEGRILDFRSFLNYVCTKLKKNPCEDHFLFRPLFDELKKGDIEEGTWAWLEGRGGMKGEYTTLYDYTTSANIYCNILSCIGWLTASVLGMHGFLILLDEAETAKSMYYGYQVERGLNFFRGLALVANDDYDLFEDRVVKGENCYVGSKTNLVYSGHLKVPYFYNNPTFLKIVYAITPGSLTSELKKWRESITFLYLDNLLIEDLQRLFNRFIELYKNVYGIEVKKSKRNIYFRHLLERAEFQSTRIFIKSMVELLDFIRFYPDEDVEKSILL